MATPLYNGDDDDYDLREVGHGGVDDGVDDDVNDDVNDDVDDDVDDEDWVAATANVEVTLS